MVLKEAFLCYVVILKAIEINNLLLVDAVIVTCYLKVILSHPHVNTLYNEMNGWNENCNNKIVITFCCDEQSV